MRFLLVSLVLLGGIMVDGRHDVRSQPYCAKYYDGTEDCGIPTLEGCQQSVSGVGGYCAPDLNAQQKFGQEPLSPSQDNPKDNPYWMPPPPSE